ncbi:MAG TPA: zinc ribbon domain-containing protein, partial [Thermosynechococcaceae cyanobacterium]
MLVCPQCQFENPDTNKFCQECGTSLTQNVCPECASLVPFHSVHCQVCDTVAGVIWWAIRVEDNTSQPSLTPSGLNPSGEEGAELTYLDAQQRYQVLEVLPPDKRDTQSTHFQST